MKAADFFRRNSQHYYVFWTMESSRTLLQWRKKLKKYDSYFNLTMTYRLVRSLTASASFPLWRKVDA